MNLYAASRQWATRPADERFATLDEMFSVCNGHRQTARQATVKMRDLRVEATSDNDLVLTGRSGTQSRFTNWSFGQLARTTKAPAAYLARLPAPLAAQNINHGIQTLEEDAESNILLHQNGSLLCRAFTSDAYARIWNADIVDRLRTLPERGWRVPPARPAFEGQPGSRLATAADVLNQGNFGLSIKVGDLIAPAGLYASDHDMFAFMVNDDVRINDGSPEGLGRGVFVTNSEVGAAALKVTRFKYRYVCGNHIVWDAKDVQELRVIHTGKADEVWADKLTVELRNYAESSASDEEAQIAEARRFQIGSTVEEVLDRLFAIKSLGLTRTELDASAQWADHQAQLVAGENPYSAWGFAQGVTAYAQTASFADERDRLDRAAGKIIQMAF